MGKWQRNMTFGDMNLNYASQKWTKQEDDEEYLPSRSVFFKQELNDPQIVQFSFPGPKLQEESLLN